VAPGGNPATVTVSGAPATAALAAIVAGGPAAPAGSAAAPPVAPHAIHNSIAMPISPPA
jgi:hypothetical protein